MNWTLNVRSNAKDTWHNLSDEQGITFASKEEAEQARNFGLSILGGEAEVVCVECDKPVTHKAAFSRIQKAG